MKNLKVTEKYNNKNLITFLQNNFDGLNISTIYKALRKKDIRINDVKISENCLLKTGDDIKIYITDNLLYKTYNVEIIYEDDNIVVFDKPSGLETTGPHSLSTYASTLYKEDSFIMPCHRLDRNTEGLVLFAKNKTAHTELLFAFKNHLIEKHYIAVVNGIPKPPQKKLEAYLFKDSKKSKVYISDTPKKGYQKIITIYSTLKINKNENLTLLDIELKTRQNSPNKSTSSSYRLPYFRRSENMEY